MTLSSGATRRSLPASTPTYGGFGAGAQVPSAAGLSSSCFELAPASLGGVAPLFMLGSTLDAMARGGIHDQVGGGFARYSVDAGWLVPHFEKMLYDNAQLARLYLWAWRELRGRTPTRAVVGCPPSSNAARRGQPDGGFWSGEDADSEGEEGRFYVFTADEMREVLGEEDFEPASLFFGVTAAGNFEGSNVLHQADHRGGDGGNRGRLQTRSRAALSRARDRLSRGALRPSSPRVGRQGRRLVERSGAAGGGRGRRRARWSGAIWRRRAALPGSCSTASTAHDGRLLRSWSPHGPDGGGVPGFLEDHAALAVGLLALYQATGETDWHAAARRTVDAMRYLFDDGTLRRVGRDAEQCGGRPPGSVRQPAPLGELAVGRGAAPALALHRRAPHREAAEAAPGPGSGIAARYPTAVGHLLAVGSLGGDRGEGAGGGRLLRRRTSAGCSGSGSNPASCMAWSTDGSGADEVPLLAERWRPGETLADACEGIRLYGPGLRPDGAASRAGLIVGE